MSQNDSWGRTLGNAEKNARNDSRFEYGAWFLVDAYDFLFAGPYWAPDWLPVLLAARHNAKFNVVHMDGHVASYGVPAIPFVPWLDGTQAAYILYE